MTNKLLSAYTGPTGEAYPAYVNLSLDGNEVVVTLRAAATKREGVFVCGYHPRDTRTPGRCTPGNKHCNNYCNTRPGEPMPDAPRDHTHIDCGATVSMRLPLAEASKLLIDAFAELGEPK